MDNSQQLVDGYLQKGLDMFDYSNRKKLGLEVIIVFMRTFLLTIQYNYFVDCYQIFNIFVKKMVVL